MADLEQLLRDGGQKLESQLVPVTAREIIDLALAEDPPPLVEPSESGTEAVGPRRWSRLAVAAAACVAVLLGFLPILLFGQDEPNPGSPVVTTLPEDTVTTTPPPIVTSPLQEEGALAFWLSRRTETELGTIQWYRFTSEELLPGAQRFSWEGVHYAHAGDVWWESSDRLNWFELVEPPVVAPPAAGERFAAFVSDGDLYASAVPYDSEDLHLLRRVAADWEDLPITIVRPPEGIDFIADTEPVIHEGQNRSTYISEPSVVVIRDGSLMQIPAPDDRSSGVVTLGEMAFGLSLEGDPDDPDGLELWRSTDGTTWAEITPPEIDGDDLAWAYLTSGHGRLMITIGDTDLHQVVWTSSDGVTWAPVQTTSGFSGPAPPQSTDFGWMIMSIGRGLIGDLYNPRHLTFLLSEDGVNWARASSMPPGFGGLQGLVASVAMPVYYQDGLFVRTWVDGSDSVGFFEQ